jgi:hypothetical protein
MWTDLVHRRAFGRRLHCRRHWHRACSEEDPGLIPHVRVVECREDEAREGRGEGRWPTIVRGDRSRGLIGGRRYRIEREIEGIRLVRLCVVCNNGRVVGCVVCDRGVCVRARGVAHRPRRFSRSRYQRMMALRQ